MFVGIDVSKYKLDVYYSEKEEYKIFKNTDEGIKELYEYLKPLEPKLIGLEATGGLELKMLYFLSEKGLKLASINPKQVRDFAKASGQHAKTDKIDSKIIARFIEVFNPPVTKIASGEETELNELVVRRKQLIDILVSEKNRLSSSRSKSSENSIKKHIEWVEKEIKDIEKNISEMLVKSSEWKKKEDILKSIPSVGNVLAFSLLSGLPELGKLTSKEITALVGLAPINKDSGKFKGKRFTSGGRGDIRNALYMPTLSATRFNITIKSFYERLIQAGKPPKVAITACMHKLLIIMNAMIKNLVMWDSEFLTNKLEKKAI
jgi:transposase